MSKGKADISTLYPLAPLWPIFSRIEGVIMRIILLPNLITQDIKCLKHKILNPF